ncbi:hypothetical protein, partial [Lacticaseibacillus suihuaensis]
MQIVAEATTRIVSPLHAHSGRAFFLALRQVELIQIYESVWTLIGPDALFDAVWFEPDALQENAVDEV